MYMILNCPLVCIWMAVSGMLVDPIEYGLFMVWHTFPTDSSPRYLGYHSQQVQDPWLALLLSTWKDHDSLHILDW